MTDKTRPVKTDDNPRNSRNRDRAQCIQHLLTICTKTCTEEREIKREREREILKEREMAGGADGLPKSTRPKKFTYYYWIKRVRDGRRKIVNVDVFIRRRQTTLMTFFLYFVKLSSKHMS